MLILNNNQSIKYILFVHVTLVFYTQISVISTALLVDEIDLLSLS
jgi:hypothetical protein